MIRRFITVLSLILAPATALAYPDKDTRTAFEKKVELAEEAIIIPVVEFRVAPGFELFEIWPKLQGVDLKGFPDELLKELRSKDAKNRHLAVDYLAHLAIVVRTCAWERERDDSNAPFRLALGRYEKAVKSALEQTLKEGPQEDRALAAVAILSFAPDHRSALEVILNELRAEHVARRLKACEYVGNARLSQPQIVTALATNIGDASGDIRRAAAEAAWHIGPAAAKAVPALIQLLKSGDEAYGDVVPFAVLAGPTRRNLALLALAEMGADARPAVPVITALLKDANGNKRLDLLHCLAALRQNAREALPDLRKRLSKDAGYERLLAAAVMLCIDPEDAQALEALLAAMKSTDQRTRNDGLNACFLFGPRVKALIPFLVASLKDDFRYQESDSVNPTRLLDRRFTNRECAFQALELMGPLAESAIPALTELVVSGSRKPEGGYDWTIHEAAARALGGIGKASIPALVKVINNPEADGRDSAAFALGRVGNGATEATPALIEALSNKEPWIRCCAAVSLGRLRCRAAKEALLGASRIEVKIEEGALQAEAGLFAQMMAAWALTQLER